MLGDNAWSSMPSSHAMNKIVVSPATTSKELREQLLASAPLELRLSLRVQIGFASALAPLRPGEGTLHTTIPLIKRG
jgi:hypothetical protein